jgi:hypothetical protein
VPSARTARAGFKGAIFDVNGVIVDSPHEEAWSETLRELMVTRWSYLRAETTWTPGRFNSQVCQEIVAGKPSRDLPHRVPRARCPRAGVLRRGGTPSQE